MGQELAIWNCIGKNLMCAQLYSNVLFNISNCSGSKFVETEVFGLWISVIKSYY